MSDTSTIYDLVESWMTGEMDTQTRLDFEQRMKSEPAFQQEVEETKDMILSIEYANVSRIKGKLEKIHHSNKNTKQPILKNMENTNQSNRKKPYWWAIAATIALLVGASYFLLNEPATNINQENGFEKYYAPEGMLVNQLLEDLESSGFADPNKEKNTALSNALTLYKTHVFKDAKTELIQILAANPNNKTAQLYLGLTELQLGLYGNAVQFLQPLNDPNYEHNELVKWYLGMAYTQTMKDEGIIVAKELFRQLSLNKKSNYYKEAKEYLRLLNT